MHDPLPSRALPCASAAASSASAFDNWTLNGTPSYGVGLRSFRELYLDSCGMFKDAIIAILGVIAKPERVRISERVRAGLDRARVEGTRSGRPVGRPRVIFRDDQVFELRNQGQSWRQISKQCGVGVTTVRRAYETMKAKRGIPKPD